MASPQAISSDIFSTITATFDLIGKLQHIRPFSKDENDVLINIGSMMPILFDKIVKHYEADEQSHIKAFQLSHTYPSLFKSPQTLEIIISYLYTLLKAIQQRTSYMFFADYDHIMYAERLVTANKIKVTALINAR